MEEILTAASLHVLRLGNRENGDVHFQCQSGNLIIAGVADEKEVKEKFIFKIGENGVAQLPNEDDEELAVDLIESLLMDILW